MTNVTVNTAEEQISRSVISALQPDLPLLASRAAIELDNLILNRPSALTNVLLLAACLLNPTEQDDSSGRQFTADPATLDVLTKALGAADNQVGTIQDAAR